jgi:hypothetical protein
MRERRSELSTDDGSMKRRAVQWEGRKDVEKLGFGKVWQVNGSFGVIFRLRVEKQHRQDVKDEGGG